MPSFIYGLPVEQMGWGLVALFVTALLFGWVVPRWYIREVRAELKAVKDQNAELIQQNGKLLEHGETSLGIMRALRTAAEESN